MNTIAPTSGPNMLANPTFLPKKSENVSAACHTSPRISSPLTPPATGETKINDGQSSSGGAARTDTATITKRRPKDLSVSPTARILNAFPIRDSPRNPFLQGGPADAGLSGPRMWQAKQRMAKIPKRERGKMTYVFRGQRVTYAEPLASDSEDDEDVQGTITSTYLGDGYWRHERNHDRLQPRILFPQAMSTSSASSSSSSSSSSLSMDISKKRQAQADCLSENDFRFASSCHVSQSKRRKTEGMQEQNRDLLAHLDRAGWNSDGELEIEEEDEVSKSMLVNQADNTLTEEALRPSQINGFDESEDEENEVEENPFLDSAPMQRSNSRTYEEERASIFGLEREFEQKQKFHSSNHLRSKHSSNPYANRPRGHAHSLAHSMHVPGHLRGRR